MNTETAIGGDAKYAKGPDTARPMGGMARKGKQVAGLIYFVAGQQAAKPAIEAAGLGYAFDGFQPTAGETSRGPDGTPGVLMTVGSAKLGWFEHGQTWMKDHGGRFWAGFYTDDRPTPADLQRPSLIGGYRVRLEDGNEWLVPIARQFPEGSQLPRTLLLGPDGKLVAEIRAEYIALWKSACRVWQSIAGQQPTAKNEIHTDLEEATCWRIAIEALAVNYRLGVTEANLLRLIGSQTLPQIMMLLIDWPTYQAATAVPVDDAARSKKNETPAGSNTGNGEAAC